MLWAEFIFRVIVMERENLANTGQLKDIAIVRNNLIVYDTGLVRVIRTLARRYSTVVLGWDREHSQPYDSDKLKKQILGRSATNNSIDLKILKLKAPVRAASYVRYLPLVFFFPVFWIWVFINLVIHKPKVVTACDLDTVFPCYVYKKLFRKKLVFYVFDRYALTFIPKKFNLLFNAINTIEESYSKRSDVLITVAEKVLATFKKKPKHCAILMNSPEDHNYGDKGKYRKDRTFRIVYGGHIMHDRSLEIICSAIKGLNNVEFYMHGLLIDKKLLDEISLLPNVKYKGYLTNSDEYYKSIMMADVMIAVYAPGNASYSITMHNKTYEAMMCGIPIITNLSSEFVKNLEFGIIVDYGNVEQIRTAIVNLRDNPKLCETLGNNGRKAYLEKYNWKIAEKEIYRICDNLLGYS